MGGGAESDEEASTLYRDLAACNHEAFQPDLAMSLNNLGLVLSELGRPNEALQSVEEALDKLWLFFLRFPQPLEQNTGLVLAHLAHLHESLQRSLPPELRERIATFKRLTQS